MRNKISGLARAAAVASVLAIGATSAGAVDISGAGATFPYPIYAKWADAYKKETGVGMNYQSIGSGGGIKQIKAKTVTFGATDAPLTGKDLDESGLSPVPGGHGRHRAGGQSRRRQARRARDRRPDARQDLPRRDHEVGRCGDQEAQPEGQAAEPGDRHRASLGRVGHDLQLHLLPGRGQRRTGSRRSASTPLCNGRPASAPRATRASPTTSPRPRARSATSSTPTPSRTS